MATSLVKVLIIGTVAEKPLIQSVGGGARIAGLSVYTSRDDDAASGTPRGAREWHCVVITLPRLVEFAATALDTGSQVYLEGELVTERWVNDLYESRSLTSIVLSQESHQLSCFREDAETFHSRGPSGESMLRDLAEQLRRPSWHDFVRTRRGGDRQRRSRRAGPGRFLPTKNVCRALQ